MTKLTKQQEAFALNIIEGMNQTDAYKAAGYKCANDNVAAVSASELVRNPKVVQFIDAHREKAAEKAVLTAAHFAKRLERLAVAAEKTAFQQASEAAQKADTEMLPVSPKEAADIARQCTMDAAKLLGLIVDQSKVQSENVHFTVSDQPMTAEEWEAEYGEEDSMESPARSTSRVN